MNKQEAYSLAERILGEYRVKAYSELAAMVGKEEGTGEIKGPSGTTYQFEIQAIWDDRHHKNVRVSCAIDNGGWRAFMPLSDDFIKAPDGTFIGE